MGRKTTQEQEAHRQRHWAGPGAREELKDSPCGQSKGRDEAEGETEALGPQRP